MEDRIPFVIPNFNQVHYLKNLILWLRWYYPKNPIYILDNHSTYAPLLEYYRTLREERIIMFPENDCAGNLKKFIKQMDFEWYVIADPDVMPHPTVPPNFLSIFKRAVESGYHHAGFDIITDDLPDWLHKKAHIVHDENLCRAEAVSFEGYEGFRGAIDTTFALFWKGNGGWSAPMDAKAWSNGLRLFKAFHFKFYQHPDFINEELDNYFKTATYRDLTPISAGKNYFRPPQYEK